MKKDVRVSRNSGRKRDKESSSTYALWSRSYTVLTVLLWLLQYLVDDLTQTPRTAGYATQSNPLSLVRARARVAQCVGGLNTVPRSRMRD